METKLIDFIMRHRLRVIKISLIGW